MKNHAEIAEILKEALRKRQVTQATLRREAGISQRTLTKVLSGEEDFKLSTLFALADRLNLELVMVPKIAAAAVSAGPAVTQPVVKSVVQKALDAVRQRQCTSGKPP